MPHRLTSATVTLLLTALLLVGCGEDAGSQAQPAGPDEPTNAQTKAPIQPIVDAAAVTRLRQEAAAKGQVLVVDCWATWCGSCVSMFPKLHAAMAERGDKARLVTLCYDEGVESIEQAGAFLSNQHAWEDAYLAKADSDEKDLIAKALSSKWDGGGLPAVFVYDARGNVVYELLETRGTPEDWVAAIMAAVDQAAGK